MPIRRALTCVSRGLAVAGALLSLPSLADSPQPELYKVTARKGNKTFKTDALVVYYENLLSGREVRSGKQVRLTMPAFTRLEIRDGRYTFQFPPACKDGKPRTLVLDNARFAPGISLRDPSLCALAPTEVVLEPGSGKSPDCSMSKALRAKVAKIKKECEQEGGCGDFEPCSFAYSKNYRSCEQLFSSEPIEGESTSLERLEGPDYDPANPAQTAAACRAGSHVACADLIPNRPQKLKIRCNGRFSNGTGFGTWVESEAECMLRGYLEVLRLQCEDGKRIDGQVFFAPQGAAEKWQPVLTPPPQELLESIQAAPARP
ncbi:hypothetical protein BO221_36295 [Archangium sp. Cb G35]|uniref:hypothetical protein n=1 Tax=Archangium sp. Cb G35 TaxID=1920190 RepID=UPI0009357EE7|nr:hypothetical protein [Archangium sp. Cb G35]OJT18985.1 hypothetical protein BO221_36295 [Archangium sp. Cb G35]